MFTVLRQPYGLIQVIRNSKCHGYLDEFTQAFSMLMRRKKITHIQENASSFNKVIKFISLQLKFKNIKQHSSDF